MADRSQRLVNALNQMGFSVPDDFEPNPDSPYHEDVQLVLASSLIRRTAQSPRGYKGDYGWEVWWYVPANFGLNEHGWLELGHADGGNYTVFILDPSAADPMVARYDHEDPSAYVQLSATLSDFILGLQVDESMQG